MEETKTNFFLIRHGKSEGNLEYRFQGHDDSPLSDLGRGQATLLGEKLKERKFYLVYHSPLRRARETAEIVFSEHKIQLIENKGLLERNFGILDGMKLDEAKKKFSNAEEFFHGRAMEIDAPGVENISNLQERSWNVFNGLAAENQGKSIAIVGHLFWTKALLSKILGMPYEEVARNYRVGTTSLTSIEVISSPEGTEFKILKIGDETHLKAQK